MALVGGNLLFEGGLITTPEARIELGSVGSDSSVSFTPTSQGLKLGYETVTNFQDIQLSQGTTLAISVLGTAPPFRSRAIGDGAILANRELNRSRGGDITIQGNNITIASGTSLIATGKYGWQYNSSRQKYQYQSRVSNYETFNCYYGRN